MNGIVPQLNSSRRHSWPKYAINLHSWPKNASSAENPVLQIKGLVWPNYASFAEKMLPFTRFLKKEP
jgi:hypothetical protein